MKATYQFLSLKEANAPMMAEIEEAANRVIRSGWYINGENVKEFEDEFAQYNQVKYAIAVSNGYDALKLILRAYIELGCMAPGDEVIVPTNTYIASALAVSDNGLVPVFAEPDAETMNLDIAKIEQYVSDKTKAIMPVHLYGTPCWSKALKEMAENRNLKIIEDNGGTNTSSISRKTSFVLVGENMGPQKRAKAEELGVRIVDEEEFLAMIENNQD